MISHRCCRAEAAARVVFRVFSTSRRTLTKRRSNKLHSSAKASASADTSDMVSSFLPPVMAPGPSLEALRSLFVASAVPMVGFGFMDNFVMIQAGQYIDNTLGLQLGLATLTAAAAGQVVSDVSGVVFGQQLEHALKPWIPPVRLTASQQALPICRWTRLAGAVVGVTIGCGLGALTLWTVDLGKRQRQEYKQRVLAVLRDLQEQLQQETRQSISLCLYFTDNEKLEVENLDKDDDETRSSLFSFSSMGGSPVPLSTSSVSSSSRIQSLGKAPLELQRAAKLSQTVTMNGGAMDDGNMTVGIPLVAEGVVVGVLAYTYNATNSEAGNNAGNSTALSSSESADDFMRRAETMAEHLSIFLRHISVD